MVGYGGTSQYRIWIPNSNKVKIRVSRDVRFLEESRKTVGAQGNVNTAPSTEPRGNTVPVGNSDGNGNAFIYDTIEVLPEPAAEPERETESDKSESEDENGSEDGSESGSGVEIGKDDDIHGGNDGETAPRSPTVEPETVQHEAWGQRARKLPIRLDPGTYVSAQHESQSQSHVSCKADTTMWNESTTYMEPQSYSEAVNDPLYSKECTVAIQEEYDSLLKNGAWKLVDLPPNKNLVTCTWAFKAKHDANGNITRFKARLVARGFSQAYGIDYFDTFAPVAKLTTYRVIFGLAAMEQWEIHGMDVITAYLLGKLDEEIYMMQPERFVNGNAVCRLLRSLYGLKQAAHVWNLKIHAFQNRLHQIQRGSVRLHRSQTHPLRHHLG
jgi:hypothetical protein